jgi:uncharacterized protein with PQ loop repeat
MNLKFLPPSQYTHLFCLFVLDILRLQVIHMHLTIWVKNKPSKYVLLWINLRYAYIHFQFWMLEFHKKNRMLEMIIFWDNESIIVRWETPCDGLYIVMFKRFPVYNQMSSFISWTKSEIRVDPFNYICLIITFMLWLMSHIHYNYKMIHMHVHDISLVQSRKTICDL